MNFNFFNELYNLIKGILDFFSGDDEVEFNFTDPQGNKVYKKIPTLSQVEKKIKKDLSQELKAYTKFYYRNNKHFQGEIKFSPKIESNRCKCYFEIEGSVKFDDIWSIKCSQEIEIDRNYYNYLYYDLQQQQLVIKQKPYKIGYNPFIPLVTKNNNFNFCTSIFTNFEDVKFKHKLFKFFNDWDHKRFLKVNIQATGDLKDDYIEIGFQFPKNININSIFINSDYDDVLEDKSIQVLASTNGKLYRIIHRAKSLKELQCFPNANYYKYYKVRFYNTTPESLTFKIFDFNLGTTHIIFNDYNDEKILENIDDIFIPKNLVYLGEIKEKNNQLYFKQYYDKNLFLTDFEKFNFNFTLENPFKDETADIDIYISFDEHGFVREKATKYFKILQNSEFIQVMLHNDVYPKLTNFYFQLEIKRRNYEFFGT
jgi:hypothetical protein